MRTPRFFRSPSDCDNEFGLIAVDHQLSSEKLVDAYSHGIFPWPAPDEETPGGWFVGWYSPHPRAILRLNNLKIPSRLRRKLNAGRFRFSWNRSFEHVLHSCATVGNRSQQVWLTAELQTCLLELHQQGAAHSLEVYDSTENGDAIIGGLYGVTEGGIFSAESMFHLQADASKAAICALCLLLRSIGADTLDIQMQSPHMEAMGSSEIARSRFLGELSEAQKRRPLWPKPLTIPTVWEDFPARCRQHP